MERITRRAEEITLRRWEDLLSSLSKRFGPLSGKVVPGFVETQDLLRVIEEYRKIKEVVEKIRYGQYL